MERTLKTTVSREGSPGPISILELVPRDPGVLQDAAEVPSIQWVDLRENLQETIDFPMIYGIFL